MSQPSEPAPAPGSSGGYNFTDEDHKILKTFVERAGGQAGPLDTTQYTPNLEAPDIPLFEWPTDPKPLEGLGSGTAGTHRELLVNLSKGDQVRLLDGINIRPRGDSWEMRGFVVGGDLEPANTSAVRFRTLDMLTPDKGRSDSLGVTYNAFESNLQRYTVVKSDLGVGIPEIFKVDASYSDTSAVATSDRTLKIFTQASQLIPKAKVVINQRDISLDPDFVSKVEEILNAGTKKQRIDELLDLLNEYGHFVALSMMLGGRITLHSSTDVQDRAEFQMVKREFKAAADAKFAVDGVPVQAGGGVGAGTGQTSTNISSSHALSLLMVLKGGDENLASSKAGELGTKWIASLGQYREWKIVGFYENSLVPIIAFLPKALHNACRDILRDYFVSKLDITNRSVGDKHGKDISSPDRAAPDPHLVKRITGIEVKYGGCLDALRVSYEVFADGGRKTETVTTKWAGSTDAGGANDSIKLKDDEEITAIETWIDPKRDNGVVLRAAFRTSRGARYPADGFYGRNKGQGEEFKTVEAPRVRGIMGSSGAYIHRLGVSYAALATNAKSREYLLAMEPFLFPERDYGIIS